MTKQIEIGKRLGQRYTLQVDDADYERVAAHKWWPFRREHLTYARGIVGGRYILLHRFILKPPKGRVVDHIDGNPLNNQRSNLRVCTQAENNTFTAARRPRLIPTHTTTIDHRRPDGTIKTYTFKRKAQPTAQSKS